MKPQIHGKLLTLKNGYAVGAKHELNRPSNYNSLAHHLANTNGHYIVAVLGAKGSAQLLNQIGDSAVLLPLVGTHSSAHANPQNVGRWRLGTGKPSASHSEFKRILNL